MSYINKDKVIRISNKDENKKRNFTTKWTKYYTNQMWIDLRNYYIQKHPLCEICSKHGRVTPATEVHHIVPFGRGKTDEEKEKLFYNENNLMSLCNKCHKGVHKVDYERGLMFLDQLDEKTYRNIHFLDFIS